MFVLREAGHDDLPLIRSRLPESLGGTPPSRFVVASDVATGAVAGFAALRVFIDSVGRFLLFVEPSHRRRGCGTALLEAVRHLAGRAGVRLLLSGRSYPDHPDDADGRAVLAFFRARGLTPSQEIARFHAITDAARAVLEPLYRRYARRPAGPRELSVVAADQVDARPIADFAVRHVGGLPEEIAARLRGQGLAFSPAISSAALQDGKVVGALLCIADGSHLFIETRAVDSDHRGGPLNLLLLYRSFEAAVRAGVATYEFEAETTESDTHKLVKRLGAVPAGRRFCWSAPVPKVEPQPPAPAAVAVRCSHTVGFAELLDQFHLSLAVTTAQAGKLVFLRPDGKQVNTHLRNFHRPMGLAVDGPRLAIGTAHEIWEFHDAPAAANLLPADGRPDACFLPRGSHTTGDIHIHEMAWADGDLWFVNTRFSCLCSRDVRYSFVPRWRPPFVTALAAEDRCHLNGFCPFPAGDATRPGEPRWYVTALGTADTAGGWRDRKRDGGVVLDTGTNAVVAGGLSLPHSPRWYDGRLWVLESGTGTLGTIDPRAGRYEPVIELPGFTRGLAFWGRYAFVGLSKMRHGRLYGDLRGIPIAARSEAERACGVWAVDIVTGQVVAWLRFDEGVQEIFAVDVVPRRRPDLINHAPEVIANAFVVPEAIFPSGGRQPPEPKSRQ